MLKWLSVKRVVAIISVLIVVILPLLSWPVYQFFAYKGKAPLPPFYQFVGIPDTTPTSQKLHDEDYKKAGSIALELLTAHQKKINAPAISAAVAIDNKLIWAGASGWADIDSKTPVTTESQFRIGSTSKALTGTALARMVDQQLIDIDQPISHYMNNLLNKEWGTMTARQLVSHMSGLPHYKENTDRLGLYKTLALSTRYENVEQALKVFDESELLFNPGSDFSYSSFGTVLLSAVMKNASNKPYVELMREQVFKPLAMHSTMAEYEAEYEGDYEVEHEGENNDNLVTFYWNDEGRSNEVRPWREVDLSHRLAGGGFISTSSDLVKMGVAFLQDDFISPATRKTFWTPQILPNGDEAPSGYSLGWRVITYTISEDIGDVTVANHGGVSRGAQSWLMVIPKFNMSVAVNINANTDVFWDFGKVSMQVAKAFIIAQ